VRLFTKYQIYTFLSKILIKIPPLWYREFFLPLWKLPKNNESKLDHANNPIKVKNPLLAYQRFQLLGGVS